MKYEYKYKRLAYYDWFAVKANERIVSLQDGAHVFILVEKAIPFNSRIRKYKKGLK